MKTTYKWLKEIIDFSFSPEDLSNKLSQLGLVTASLKSLNNDDWVYEFERLPNRPDWLSVRGIAREISALSETHLRKVSLSINSEKTSVRSVPFFKVDIAEKSLCPRYSYRIFSGINVEASPSWLVHKLEASGIHSVNNIVDILNYVMLEYGHPLHAFDSDQIDGNSLVVAKAKQGTSVISLDGTEYSLTENMLVVSDASNVLALAGIVGTQKAQISQSTQTIVLESAYFDPLSIRKTARSLGISTESSYRFERGMDVDIVPTALDRASQMILDLLPKSVCISMGEDHYVKKIPSFSVCSTCSNIKRILGVHLTGQQIKTYLEWIDFSVTILDEDRFEVHIPSFRREVAEEADIAEEIARLYGYENIPIKRPLIQSTGLSVQDSLERGINTLRQASIRSSLKEIITYSFIDPKEQSCLQEKNITLSYPLSREQSVLRQSLIPGLIRTFRNHCAYRIDQVHLQFFELGKVFYSEKNTFHEKLCWGMISPQGIRFVRSCVEHLLKSIGVLDQVSFSLESQNDLYDSPTMNIMIAEKKCGYFSVASMAFLEKFSLKNAKQYKELVVSELFLDVLFDHCSFSKSFQPFSRYPAMQRDLVLKMPEDFSCGQIVATIDSLRLKYFKNIELFDIYRGNPLNKNEKSLGFSLFFQSLDRTLTDEEVDEEYNMILKEMKDQFNFSLREK